MEYTYYAIEPALRDNVFPMSVMADMLSANNLNNRNN